MKNIITFVKEHKKKIITVVAILIILSGAFWYGTGSKESRGFSVKSENTSEIQFENNLENTTKKSTTIDDEKTSQENDENIASTDSLENASREQGSTNGDKKADAKNDADYSEAGNDHAAQEPPQETNENAQSGNQSDVGGEEKNTFSVTLSISCSNVLNHMDQLKANKKDIIPADGWILKTVSVQMTEGETVYDALVRACKENGILTDAEYTPFYGTYYLKGIQNLYQMDCGDESGWMYKINGDVAKVGASTYKVKAGDNIQWLYTCVKGDIS